MSEVRAFLSRDQKTQPEDFDPSPERAGGGEVSSGYVFESGAGVEGALGASTEEDAWTARGLHSAGFGAEVTTSCFEDAGSDSSLHIWNQLRLGGVGFLSASDSVTVGGLARASSCVGAGGSVDGIAKSGDSIVWGVLVNSSSRVGFDLESQLNQDPEPAVLWSFEKSSSFEACKAWSFPSAFPAASAFCSPRGLTVSFPRRASRFLLGSSVD